MPICDIVGRSQRSGTRIIAQCKKHPEPEPMEAKFQAFGAKLPSCDSAFYFAYGGCSSVAGRIQIVDRALALKWAETAKGKGYLKLLQRS